MNPSSSLQPNIHEQLKAMRIKLDNGESLENDDPKILERVLDMENAAKNFYGKGTGVSKEDDEIKYEEEGLKDFLKNREVVRGLRIKAFKVGGEVRPKSKQLEEDMELLSKEFKAKVEDANKIEEIKNRLQKEVNDSETFLNRYRDEVKVLKNELGSSGLENQSLKNMVDKLDSEIKFYQLKIKDAEQDIVLAKIAIQEIEASHNITKSQVKDLESEIEKNKLNKIASIIPINSVNNVDVKNRKEREELRDKLDLWEAKDKLIFLVDNILNDFKLDTQPMTQARLDMAINYITRKSKILSDQLNARIKKVGYLNLKDDNSSDSFLSTYKQLLNEDIKLRDRFWVSIEADKKVQELLKLAKQKIDKVTPTPSSTQKSLGTNIVTTRPEYEMTFTSLKNIMNKIPEGYSSDLIKKYISFDRDQNNTNGYKNKEDLLKDFPEEEISKLLLDFAKEKKSAKDLYNLVMSIKVDDTRPGSEEFKEQLKELEKVAKQNLNQTSSQQKNLINLLTPTPIAPVLPVISATLLAPVTPASPEEIEKQINLFEAEINTFKNSFKDLSQALAIFRAGVIRRNITKAKDAWREDGEGISKVLIASVDKIFEKVIEVPKPETLIPVMPEVETKKELTEEEKEKQRENRRNFVKFFNVNPNRIKPKEEKIKDTVTTTEPIKVTPEIIKTPEDRKSFWNRTGKYLALFIAAAGIGAAGTNAYNDNETEQKISDINSTHSINISNQKIVSEKKKQEIIKKLSPASNPLKSEVAIAQTQTQIPARDQEVKSIETVNKVSMTKTGPEAWSDYKDDSVSNAIANPNLEQKQNNIGNLVGFNTGKLIGFETPELGLRGLLSQVSRDQRVGDSSNINGANGDVKLGDYITKYTKLEGGSTEYKNYLKIAKDITGKNESTLIKDVDIKKLVEAITKAEGSAYIYNAADNTLKSNPNNKNNIGSKVAGVNMMKSGYSDNNFYGKINYRLT